MTKITVIGSEDRLGYCLSAYLASLGYSVILPEGVESFNGEEPGMADLHRAFSQNIRGLPLKDALLNEVVLMAKDTPIVRGKGVVADVKRECEKIIADMKHDGILIISSQVPPGFCESLKNSKVKIACWPENIRRGRALESLKSVSTYIIGAEDGDTAERVLALLEGVPPGKFIANLRTAEASKIFLNAFLATCISYANQVGKVATEMKVDSNAIHRYITSDYRVGSLLPLRTGKPYEGPLARDIEVILDFSPSPFFRAVKEANASEVEAD